MSGHPQAFLATRERATLSNRLASIRARLPALFGDDPKVTDAVEALERQTLPWTVVRVHMVYVDNVRGEEDSDTQPL